MLFSFRKADIISRQIPGSNYSLSTKIRISIGLLWIYDRHLFSQN